MAHFSSGPGLGLSVDVKGNGGVMEGGLDVAWPTGTGGLAEEVDHGGSGDAKAGVAKGPAEDGANVVFELGAVTSLDRVMAGIVDTGGHFVDEKGSVGLAKQFHSNRANKIKRRHSFGRNCCNLLLFMALKG